MKDKKTVDELFTEVDSRYALVNAVAHKAREIADDKDRGAGIEKPVVYVLDELKSGEAKIVHVQNTEKEENLSEDEI